MTKSLTPLQLVHMAQVSFYKPILGTPIHDIATAAFLSLEQEYIGKGKLAKNKSPFISDAEYERFSAAVAPVSTTDDAWAFDERLSVAIHTINAVKADRQ